MLIKLSFRPWPDKSQNRSEMRKAGRLGTKDSKWAMRQSNWLLDCQIITLANLRERFCRELIIVIVMAGSDGMMRDKCAR